MTETPASAATPEEVDLPLPEDFDLDSWMQGLRPTVRAYTIYQRADLLAELEDLEKQLQLVEAPDADEYTMADDRSTEELNTRINALYQQLLDSRVTFKVEARSAEWLKEKGLEVKRMKGYSALSKDDKAAMVTRHQLADAVVQPKGITVEHLERLEEVAGAQYRGLVATFFDACTHAPQVTAPTSPSSSASRGGRGR